MKHPKMTLSGIETDRSARCSLVNRRVNKEVRLTEGLTDMVTDNPTPQNIVFWNWNRHVTEGHQTAVWLTDCYQNSEANFETSSEMGSSTPFLHSHLQRKKIGPCPFRKHPYPLALSPYTSSLPIQIHFIQIKIQLSCFQHKTNQNEHEVI